MGRAAIAAALLVALGASWLFGLRHGEEAVTPERRLVRITGATGPLAPGNDLTPSLEARLRDAGPLPDAAEALRIVVGTNVAIAAADQAAPLVIVGASDRDLLTLHRVGGHLTISADFFAEDGTLLARLEDNDLFVDEAAPFQADRSDDGSVLDVRDERGESVLSVRFANASSISIRGMLRHPTNGRRVEILDDRLILNGRWTSTDNLWIVLDNGPVISLD